MVTFTKRIGRIGPRCAFGEYKYCPLTWSGARKGGRFGTSPETDRRPVYTSYLYLAVVGKDTPLCVFGAAEAVHRTSLTIGTHWRRPGLPSANDGVNAPQTKTPPHRPSLLCETPRRCNPARPPHILSFATRCQGWNTTSTMIVARRRGRVVHSDDL